MGMISTIGWRLSTRFENVVMALESDVLAAPAIPSDSFAPLVLALRGGWRWGRNAADLATWLFALALIPFVLRQDGRLSSTDIA
jgi:hypothetical protein